jgi:hypothetical protein
MLLYVLHGLKRVKIGPIRNRARLYGAMSVLLKSIREPRTSGYSNSIGLVKMEKGTHYSI